MTSSITANAALSGIPDALRAPLIEEYNKVAKNFREGRWEPAELNGGKLCEIVYCILKGLADGQYPQKASKPGNMVDACKALEQADKTFPRSVRIQIPRVLVALYEIRNNRNVGHVGSDVDPNQMDAFIVYSMVRWIMAELVRIFHSVRTDEATMIVEGLTERTLPILWRPARGGLRVLRTDLQAWQKMLVLLYGMPGAVPVNTIRKSIEYKNSSRFLEIVRWAHSEAYVDFDQNASTVELSPIGVRYVEQNIPLEL